jgi:hypothetical protein
MPCAYTARPGSTATALPPGGVDGESWAPRRERDCDPQPVVEHAGLGEFGGHLVEDAHERSGQRVATAHDRRSRMRVSSWISPGAKSGLG